MLDCISYILNVKLKSVATEYRRIHMNLNLNRVHAKLQQKIGESVGHRVDLVQADLRKIDRETAHFMLAYDQHTPTTDDISEFFVRQYNAKIIPELATARVYPEHKVVTVVASILNLTRDYSDRTKMTPVIAECTYLDSAMGEIWEVKEAGEQKVLARRVKDDIKAIVQARRNLMIDPKVNKSFASLDINSGILSLSMIEDGDVVKAYANGKLQEDLTVQKVSENHIECLAADLLTIVNLPKGSVIEVKKKNSAADKKQQKQVQDYFADAYGDKQFAKKLTKGMPNT